jgi:uncharacterized protein (DUF58 family)
VSGGRPVPTRLAVALLTAALLPALLSLAAPGMAWVAAALDGAVVLLCAWDFVRAPKASELSVERRLEPVFSCGAWNRVELDFELRSQRPIRGEVRDGVPGGPDVEGHRQRFELHPSMAATHLSYRVWPHVRGDLAFGDAFVRLVGPLGLCARQQRIPLAASVKVYPDLRALARDALALARAAEEPADRTLRRPSEGSEFESLREYRPGDDSRTIDWKATAKRAKPMVRVYEPERNQSVLLVLDCGRHMAGRVRGRRKLDFAVDAALHLAKVCLDRGDLVGAVSFASRVLGHLPPRKGADHLRALTSALYRAQAELEESDCGAALDLAFARHHKRTLVVVFTDLQDADSSARLVTRVLALRPRHLPLVVSMLNEDVARAAEELPVEVQDAYVRHGAARLERESRLTTTRLRESGALAVRCPPSRFSAAAVNEYLRVKARGLL